MYKTKFKTKFVWSGFIDNYLLLAIFHEIYIFNLPVTMGKVWIKNKNMFSQKCIQQDR